MDRSEEEPECHIRREVTRARGQLCAPPAHHTIDGCRELGSVRHGEAAGRGGADIYAISHTQLPGEPRTAFDYAVDAGRIDSARYLWERSDGKRLGARLQRQISDACHIHCGTESGTDAHRNLVLFPLSIASEDQRSAGIGDALCTADPASSKAAFIAGHVKPFPRSTLPCVAFTSLARAVRTRVQREAMVDWMLSQGAEIDHAGAGYSAPMGAASTHDMSMLKFLLARGAKSNAANAHGLTAIGAAVALAYRAGRLPRRSGACNRRSEAHLRSVPDVGRKLGGFLIGFGLLALLRHRASVGGVNILAQWLQQTKGLSAGKIQMSVDVLVVLAALFVVPPARVLQSVVGAFAIGAILALNHKPGRYLGV